MAHYKYKQVLVESNSKAFDDIHQPGSTVPYSSIYRCEGCLHEVACNANDPFPPQNHPQHTTEQGKIRWRLVVFAQAVATTAKA